MQKVPGKGSNDLVLLCGDGNLHSRHLADPDYLPLYKLADDRGKLLDTFPNSMSDEEYAMGKNGSATRQHQGPGTLTALDYIIIVKKN